MNENEFNNLDLLQWFVNLCHVNNNNNVKNNLLWNGEFPWNFIITKSINNRKMLQLEYQFFRKNNNSNVDDDKKVVTGEFYVVYSFNYQVPVLYFNYYYANGMYLNIEEIETLVVNNNNNPIAQNEKNNTIFNINELITQTEHPILKKTFYMLHPCRTEVTLAKFNLERTKNQIDDDHKHFCYLKRYLITWFHIYGALLNLHLPIIFFNNVLKSIDEINDDDDK